MNWLDAIACRTHRWVWRQTWHDVGFDECSTCGVTRAVVSRQTPAPSDESPVAAPATDLAYPTAGALPLDTAGRGSSPARAPRLDRQRHRPTVVESAARAAAVLAELARGTKPPAVATMFKISPARVYQIRAQRAEAAS